jgi:hypothetical protein
MFAAAISVAGMWIYGHRVLVAHQLADAGAHGSPRGNLSDLYPRWLGARELLQHRRDPYSREVTLEIQEGYYGRVLDANRPEDPKDQQAFAYPLYVAFLLAPLVYLPFSAVQRAFFWFLFALTTATIPLWLRFLRMRTSLWMQIAIAGFLFGSFVVMQGLKLQQMSVLVAGLIAAALTLLVSGYPVSAGILLAFATIKPQLLVLLVLWLGLWTMVDLRRRMRLAISFLATMLVLIAASDWYMAHWISHFWHAVVDYQAYTRATSTLDQLLRPSGARALELVAFIVTAGFCWKNRAAQEGSNHFVINTCLVLAVTVLMVRTFAPYNQILLLPSLILLMRDRRVILEATKAGRLLWIVTATLVAWPEFASALLAGLSFILPRNLVLRSWALPLWTSLAIPVAVTALMFVYTHRTSSMPGESRRA